MQRQSLLAAVGVLLCLFSRAPTSADDSAAVKAVFASPPREFSTAPLWVWNDMLSDDQIRKTLGDLAAQNVRQAFVHPRPGLMTPYLSDEWFRLWEVALEEAERLDMNLWIYDENSYPSGFAGGWVPELMPEARGRGLRFEVLRQPPQPGDDVLGVNTLDEHLSFITIRGTRKRDHPQSFSYHEPWWDHYHVMAEYFTRLCAALSHGEQVNEILVIEPTTSAWMYQPDRSTAERMMEIGRRFQDLSNALERAQVEYDIGCEDILARHGTVEGRSSDPQAGGASAWLVVGQRRYHTVVLPPLTENLNAPTRKLLEAYGSAGGRVLCCGPPPERVDGTGASERAARVARSPNWVEVTAAELPQRLLTLAGEGFAIERAHDDQGVLFHQRRRLDDGELLLLVNTSIDHASAGQVRHGARGAEQWLPQSGKVQPYRFDRDEQGIQFRFELPPCGSLLIFLAASSLPAAGPPAAEVSTISPSGPPAIERLGPNVMTLDFVDVTAAGETRRGIYCYNATQFVFQKNGWEKNPWDHAVQFRDEIVRQPFPDDGGFEATYRFQIEQRVPERIEIVVERPDLYEVTCNGEPVQPTPDAWWLDRAFGRIDLTSRAAVGENTVTLKASPMTVFHEIEPAYVLGDFTLRPHDTLWAIIPPTPLELGPWNEQGLPFFAAGAAYTEHYEIGQPAGRYLLRVPSWYGSVAEVRVNGKPAGHLVSRPWELDVTESIRPGRNAVEIRIIGTLKNTLGPHHGQPVLGKAWPWAFRQAPATGPPPGTDYHTVGYGLFQRPVLENRRYGQRP
jgi:hypothetical protein